MSTAHPQPSQTNMPPLQAGDRLTAKEFLRRYEAMPELNKAELVEGVVHMPSPVSATEHGEPHFDLVGWLFTYRVATPGVLGGDNTTIELDIGNVPQPDAHLRIVTESGQSHLNEKGYIVGGPELVAEVSASSSSHDLQDKFQAYQRNHVSEYLVWRVPDKAVDWFVLQDGQYVRNEAQDGVVKSRAFPGLWLAVDALLQRDMKRVLEILRQGMESPEYGEFVDRMTNE